ncbi:glycosyltransferase family 4 protein [Halobacteriales archaeon Cl-PHB]
MACSEPDSDPPKYQLITQYFYPDTSANSTKLSELATGLAARGLDISVVTAQPSYSSDDRQGSEPRLESHKGVAVQRVWSTRFDRNAGTIYRLLNGISFCLVVLCMFIVRRSSRKLLLPTAPPYLPIIGYALSRIRGFSYTVLVYDFYPDMAIEVGYLSEDSFTYRLWDWLNKRTLRRAESVITIGETMAETIEAKYGQECDVNVIHNWEDGDFIVPQQKDQNLFSKSHGLEDTFTVLYSGNLGQHHDLESVVKAADLLESSREAASDDIEFLFIGEGGKKEKLRRMVDDRELDTVTFLPYQNRETLPDSLTAGDVALVSQEPGVEGLCVSSKFYTALASGQAVLVIATPDSEIGRIVEQTNVGTRVDPKSPDQIQAVLESWLDDSERVTKFGEQARKVFEREYTKDGNIDQYYDLLVS